MVKVVESRGDWSKVQAVAPPSLTATHIGYLPRSLLFNEKHKSTDERQLDHQLESCGRDAGTLSLLPSSKLLNQLRTLVLTEFAIRYLARSNRRILFLNSFG